MGQKILNELSELQNAGILSEETAEKIKAYYQAKSADAPNRLTLIFSILGAVLIGLGIILIVAHNWDNLSKMPRTVFAFLPLLIGQGLCAYTILKKPDSIAWRETSATFLFFAIGSSISLVSQIYNINGEMSTFLMTWSLLALPLVYLLRSSMVSLLYIVFVSWYATSIGYDGTSEIPYFYPALLALIIPYFYQLFQTQPNSNFFNFHCWVLTLSFVITLGTFTDEHWQFMWMAYISMFSLFVLISRLPAFANRKVMRNPFLVVGVLGTVICFISQSFIWFWEELMTDVFVASNLLQSAEFWLVLIFVVANLALILKREQASGFSNIHPLAYGFLVYIIAFAIGSNIPIVGILLCNFFLLWTGIYYINRGKNEDHLGLLNLGLIIITALIVCRFFDTNMSFIFRGLLFVGLGISFFVANHQLLKRRRAMLAEQA